MWDLLAEKSINRSLVIFPVSVLCLSSKCRQRYQRIVSKWIYLYGARQLGRNPNCHTSYSGFGILLFVFSMHATLFFKLIYVSIFETETNNNNYCYFEIIVIRWLKMYSCKLPLCNNIKNGKYLQIWTNILYTNLHIYVYDIGKTCYR